jgi:adenosine kinase
MTEAPDIDLTQVAEHAGGLGLVLVGADDPAAMTAHTAAAHTLGVPVAADPSQQLARLDGESIKGLVNGATYLFTNTYERALLLQRTGWKEETVTERVGTWITTLGADGIRIDRAGLPTLYVPAADVEAIADPTGAGDAFRSGFLAATAWGLDLLTAARTGCALAAAALETVGTQDYPTHLPSLTARLNRSYGAPTAQALRPHARRQGAQP